MRAQAPPRGGRRQGLGGGDTDRVRCAGPGGALLACIIHAIKGLGRGQEIAFQPAAGIQGCALQLIKATPTAGPPQPNGFGGAPQPGAWPPPQQGLKASETVLRLDPAKGCAVWFRWASAEPTA